MNKIIGLFTLILMATYGWAQDNIEFTYEFEKDKSNSNLINVMAKIINKSENDIYFLSESCNGLDYYLTTNTTSAEIFIMIHCNVTYPRKIELKANSDYEFKTIIQLKGSVEKVGLNLKLLKLGESVQIEGKFIDVIRKENTKQTMNLEGVIIKI